MGSSTGSWFVCIFSVVNDIDALTSGLAWNSDYIIPNYNHSTLCSSVEKTLPNFAMILRTQTASLRQSFQNIFLCLQNMTYQLRSHPARTKSLSNFRSSREALIYMGCKFHQHGTPIPQELQWQPPCPRLHCIHYMIAPTTRDLDKHYFFHFLDKKGARNEDEWDLLVHNGDNQNSSCSCMLKLVLRLLSGVPQRVTGPVSKLGNLCYQGHAHVTFHV